MSDVNAVVQSHSNKTNKSVFVSLQELLVRPPRPCYLLAHPHDAEIPLTELRFARVAAASI